MAALAANLGSGTRLPASIFVLQALHSVISPDPSGENANSSI